MSVPPIVRHMIACEDYEVAPPPSQRLSIHGLLTGLRAIDPFPVLYQGFCVVLVLTDGRGVGDGQIVCVVEETGQPVFGSQVHPIHFSNDPLERVVAPFRLRACPFPFPAMYSIQFWYNQQLIHECPLRVRSA
ncbi:MAG TPA: hypothetical protein VFV87_01015 [Pirellulaceae bacterium]|nr:hypothetical protein [Pirellulaceae bacterium]